MLHKTIATDNALKDKTTRFPISSSRTKKYLEHRYDTKVEGKGEPFVSPLPPKKNKFFLISPNTEKDRIVNKFHPAHPVPQHKDKENSSPITDDEIILQRKVNKNSQLSVGIDPSANIIFLPPKTTLNTSPIDTADQTAIDTAKPTKLVDNKETATLSLASVSKVKAKTLTPPMASYLVLIA